MKLKNCSLRVEICSDWLYARTQCHESRDQPARYGIRSRILKAVLYGRWLCGHCYLAQRRRGAEFFGDGFRLCGFWEGRPPCRPVPLRHSRLAFGRDDLRVVRYRCGIRVRLLGGTTSVSSGTAAAFASVLLGGTTSVSSGTATGVASGSWQGRPPRRPVPLRHSRLALGRDDLRVVRYRYGSGLHD